jgi:uncharacterized protein (TIGR03435 family)
MKPDFTDIEQIVDRHLPLASMDEATAAGERVWRRLQAPGDRAGAFDTRLAHAQPAATRHWRETGLAAAAVLVLAAVVGSAIGWRPVANAPDHAGRAPDINEPALYRVLEGEVRKGRTIQSDGRTGAVLSLPDGSRIEMRSQSELAPERAVDGVRIRLARGGIIVHAATQRSGHLYVQTKDVTVSVVGTVFLVNAEASGSRVAVIEGEVHVQQGAAQRTLLPGEHVATSTSVDAPPVKDAIAWSRNAEALIALLQQSTLVPPVVPPQDSATPRETFDVVSIRLRAAGAGGGRSGGPGDAPGTGAGRVPACGGGMDLDPRFVRLRGYTLYRLITMAYGGDCFSWELMSGLEPLEGGPGWIRSDQWDIEARIPEGPLPYTPNVIDIGGGRTAQQHIPGPRLQLLFRNLLADRFGLALRRETKQGPILALTVAAGGPRLTPWKEGDPVTERELTDLLIRNGTMLSQEQLAALGVTATEFADRWARRTIELPWPGMLGAKASMAKLTAQLERATLWPVVDRTGITGEFNYRLPDRGPFNGPLQPRRMGGAAAPGTDAFGALAVAVERELGLKLESARGPRDVLVIDRVTRPTEN